VILAPYTKQHPEARSLLERHAPEDITWARIDENDVTGYARLLVEAWAQPGDLVIVEHDIGVHAGVFDGFQTCGQPWCGHPYRIGDRMLVCLGCTRFTAHLKASLPNLMAEAAAVGSEQDGGGVPAGDWRRLDVRIGALLESHGHQRHPHQPAVTHYHEYPEAS
jgi:hypothetical protein